MLTLRIWVPIPLKSWNVFRFYFQLLKLQYYHCDDHILILYLYFCSLHHLQEYEVVCKDNLLIVLYQKNISDTPSFDIPHLLQVAFTIKVLSGWFDHTTHAYLYMAASLQCCQQFIHWYINTEFCSIFKVISKFLCEAKCFGCPLPCLVEQMLKSSACL